MIVCSLERATSVTAGVLMWTGRVFRHRGRAVTVNESYANLSMSPSGGKHYVEATILLAFSIAPSTLIHWSSHSLWSQWHHSNDTSGIQVTLWCDDSLEALSLTNQYFSK